MMPVPNPSQASDDDDTDTRGEPIAIVGIGCRFPGDVATPEAYWRLLLDGVDAITEVPPDRWNGKAHYDPEPGVRGKTCQRWGGFVADIDRFDPQAFGISPREAACIDPQHRLLLETAWEAIDDAGLSQAELAGSRTAVFVGLSGIDYAILQTGRTDLHDIDVYTNIGSSLSIAANRVSYTFDLRGPSVSVDTACSSSLVALHLACESLRRGDCTAALAGGVNVLLTPDGYVGFSRMAMLSPDGRCHAFDASANGFVRSEGAGMLFLRPLSQAVAHRDRIYAVIRATAANQDGRTPGITVPSQSAQEALVREACRRGGVDPAEIGYMEAHGTGTLVGDPIELRALGAVLGEGRDPDRPCWVGSSKTNIGHLEAASGMAGVIKTALMLQRRQIPRNLHFRTPNPEIDFSRLKLRVPQQTESWPTGFERAIAGVNSFGFGGTNAHVLLAEPPRAASRIDGRFAEPERELGIPLSARSLEALQATARSWSDWLSSSKEQASLIDIAYTAGLRRTHHDWRAMVVARTPDDLKQQLKLLAEGSVPGVLPSRRVEDGLDKRIVFVCAGQGPQWWGMGRELLRSEPIFRGMMEQCDAILRNYGGWSLLEELARSEADSRMHDTAIAQPALFAVQIALAALWKAWGIQPAAVTGHSVGEVAAAYLAGVFSLEDALKVIFERGRCMDLAPAGGRMLAAGVGPDEARELAKPYDGRVGIAAVNSPCSVTLSGDAPPLEEIAADLTARKIFCRLLKADYAFHSSHMDSIEVELTASLRFIDPRTARLPLVSTVTGERADGLELGPDYWWRNVRQPVLFAKAIERLLSDGYDAFVELGPHPVLLTSLEECARAADRTIIAVASLRRQLGERREMLKSLGRLYVHGAAVRWDRVNGNDGELLRLPNYPWQRERCWRESSASEAMRLADPGHPLLGRRLPAAQTIWQRRLVLREVRCLPDHRVQGSAILPATAYLEAALSAQRELFGPGHHVIENIRFDRPAVLSDERDALLQTSWNGALRRLEVSSRSADADHDWTRHASMRLRTQAVERVPSGEPLTELLRRCPAEHGRDEVYAAFRRCGLEFGPHFQGVERLYVGVHEAVAEVRLPEAVRAELSDFHWHPAALDSCFHAVGGVDPNFFSVRHDLLLPVEIDEVRCYGRPEGVMWSHARRLEQGERSLTADVLIMTGDGRCVMEIRRLVCQKIAGGQPRESVESLLYAMKWTYAGEAVAGTCLPASAAEVAERAGPEIARLREHVPCLRERYEALDKRLRPMAPLARMLGDVKFHEHQGIDRDAADRWQVDVGAALLGEPTWQIAEAFGYERPKSKSLARRPSPRDLLVPLQTPGTLPPIVWIHPPGGIVICYHALARLLGPDRPVFAVRGRGAHGEAPPHDSVEEMARDYVDEIVAGCPDGLVHLGGWSAGGVIALEVARQLRARGRDVGLVALLDSSIPVDTTQFPEDVSGLPPAVEYGLDISLVELARRPPSEQMEYILNHARQLGLVKPDTPLHLVKDTLDNLSRLFHAHVEAVQHYQLPADLGRITLFRPQEALSVEGARRDSGWSEFAAVDVRMVPGSHYTMVKEPHVRALAEQVNEALRLVEREARQSPASAAPRGNE